MGAARIVDRSGWSRSGVTIGCGALAALLTACEQAPRSYTFEIVQSYGVAEPPADSLTQPAHVRLAGGAMLGRIRGVVQTADSGVYVLDRDWYKIVGFDPDGSLRNVFLAGEGEGPGEFRNPVHMGLLPTGELVVLDYELLRLNYFDPSSGFIESSRLEVRNALRLFPLGDRIWITTNTLDPGEEGPRAIAVDRSGRRIGEAPAAVAAEIPYGGFGVLAVSPDSLLILPHNRPGLWDVFDGTAFETRGRELVPDLEPPVVVREGRNITIGPSMAGKLIVNPIAVAALRTGEVIFWYWTMETGEDERPLLETRRVKAEVFDREGNHLGPAVIPEEVGISYVVHVSPFTDHLFVPTTEPYPRVLELRLVETRYGEDGQRSP